MGCGEVRDGRGANFRFSTGAPNGVNSGDNSRLMTQPGSALGPVPDKRPENYQKDRGSVPLQKA